MSPSKGQEESDEKERKKERKLKANARSKDWICFTSLIFFFF